MKLTPARRIWLERLRDKGPQERPRGSVGFTCHQAGLTEWMYHDDSTGEILTMAEAKARYPEEFWNHVRSAGERLTEAGRRILLEKAS